MIYGPLPGLHFDLPLKTRFFGSFFTVYWLLRAGGFLEDQLQTHLLGALVTLMACVKILGITSGNAQYIPEMLDVV